MVEYTKFAGTKIDEVAEEVIQETRCDLKHAYRMYLDPSNTPTHWRKIREWQRKVVAERRMIKAGEMERVNCGLSAEVFRPGTDPIPYVKWIKTEEQGLILDPESE